MKREDSDCIDGHADLSFSPRQDIRHLNMKHQSKPSSILQIICISGLVESIFAITLLHSERPNLYTNLVFLSAIGLITIMLCVAGLTPTGSTVMYDPWWLGLSNVLQYYNRKC